MANEKSNGTAAPSLCCFDNLYLTDQTHSQKEALAQVTAMITATLNSTESVLGWKLHRKMEIANIGKPSTSSASCHAFDSTKICNYLARKLRFKAPDYSETWGLGGDKIRSAKLRMPSFIALPAASAPALTARSIPRRAE